MGYQLENRICQNCKQDFMIEPEDFNFYEKIKVPPPTFCPECRNQRRMSWRNERSLYKRKCDVPGHNEDIISMYDPKNLHVVFDNAYWWSDSWDPADYGLEYDFSSTFLSQFSKLLKTVPLATLSTLNSVNSKYTNFVDGNKNCYLIFGSGWSENCRYGNKMMSCRDSQDLLMCSKCELCYECVGCVESNNIFWSKNSKNCFDSYFLYNCRNCSNCFGCADLVSQSYCIWNKQYSKEEYFKQLEKLEIGSNKNFLKLKKIFLEKIYLSAYHRFANIFSSVNCTGDNINNSKNCKNCFDIYENIEDSKYLFSALQLKDSYDGNGVYDNEMSYEYVDCNKGNRNLSTIIVYDSNDVKYSINCHNCKDCFGCIGLRSKRYCILNQQYSKEEYGKLLPKIIEHMNTMPYVDAKGKVYKYGEFFPTELSPFAYNETIASEYFPLDADKAKDYGFNWKYAEERNYDIEISSDKIPDSINDIDEDIVGKVIGCAHYEKNSHDVNCGFGCTEAFKIEAEDLVFYKRLKIPIPRVCPNCRHGLRLQQKNPLKLWHRVCMCDRGNHTHQGKCEVEFETSYAPDRPEIVYCEKCYQQEVY